MKKPNLFILGAPKCGTTAMSTWLSSHSRVFVSPVKEPHYFSSEYRLTPTLEAYEALFEQAEEKHRWVCEASVWQMFSPNAVPAILEYCPDASFIVMLRNPVRMVPSMHRQQLVNGNEKLHDLQAALDADAPRRAGKFVGARKGYPPDHLAYLHSCALGWQLQRAMRLIQPGKLHIVVHDDLAKDAESTFAGVLAFLGLEAEAGIHLGKVNVAKTRRSYVLDATVRAAVAAKARLGLNLQTGMLSALRKWNLRVQPVPEPDAEVTSRLREAFADDVKLTSDLIGRDLSHWLKASPDGG
ncbi:MAG TPA: sulfotransferase [Thermohalobaculum sp.]|nr:sulfotransferase [Thermohalobaculum sp.]